MLRRAFPLRRVCAMALQSAPRALVARQLPVVAVPSMRFARSFCDKGKETKDAEAEPEVKPEAEAAGAEGAGEAAGTAMDEFKAQLTAVETKLEEQEKEVKKLTEALQIALAEAENARSIAKKDVARASDFAITKFAKSLLEVADNFERALQATGDEGAEPAKQLSDLSQGVKMIEAQLQGVFREHSLVRYGEIGEKFDPNIHEAMFEFEDADKDPGSVGQVVRPGYRLKDRVLRAAQVGTVKGA
eukprot:scaffold442_cov268-Pinguiococcus_pyrenoidosus.AAC.92